MNKQETLKKLKEITHERHPQWVYYSDVIDLIEQIDEEVEKEKLYTAKLKVVTVEEASYLNRHKSGGITIDSLYEAGGQYQVRFTRSELEKLNVWNNPEFEIEEAKEKTK